MFLSLIVACASAVIGEDCKVPDPGMTEEELQAESQAELDEREILYKKRAEVARLWAKYALELFTESRYVYVICNCQNLNHR